MPLNAHHKIDRKALIGKEAAFSPESSHQDSGINGELATIWREALELGKDHPVSMDDNFYELGGDSLSMLMLIHDVSKKLLCKSREAFLMKNLESFVRSPTIKTLIKLTEK